MQWLELLVSIEAAGDFLLSSLNCLYFLRYCVETCTPARKVGAAALAVIGGALALEAIVFLSQSPDGWETGSPTRSAAVLVLRSVLLFTAALVSTLIVRGRR